MIILDERQGENCAFAKNAKNFALIGLLFSSTGLKTFPEAGWQGFRSMFHAMSSDVFIFVLPI